MPVELIALGAKLLPAARHGYSVIAKELDRRLADDPADNAYRGIERDIEVILDVLQGDAATLPAALAAKARALMTRPPIFAEGVPREWIATSGARAALTQAAIGLMRGEPIDSFFESGAALYATFDLAPTDPDAAEVFATALDFVQRSFRTKMSLGERTLLNAVAGQVDRLEYVAAIAERLELKVNAVDRQAPAPLIDPHIDAAIDCIRRSRFFGDYEVHRRADALAARLTSGDLASGSPGKRAQALGWCARWLSLKDQAQGRQVLAMSRQLADTEEAIIAEAFLLQQTDWREAVGLLTVRTSRLQATAYLQILLHNLDRKAALDDLAEVGLGLDAFDAEGRFVLLTAQVEANQWLEAAALVSLLDEADFEDAPALLWIAAIVLIGSRLPPDIRQPIRAGVPMTPHSFPLPEDQESMEARRLASQLIGRVAVVCAELGLADQARGAERYRLWLDLRDDATHATAIETLKAKLRDAREAIRYIPMALAFDLAVDRDKASREIDAEFKIKPAGDQDLAMARLALVLDLSVRSPGEAADALARYRHQLRKYLIDEALVEIETEFLIRAGRRTEATALLESDDSAGLHETARQHLEHRLDHDDTQATVAELERVYARAPSTPLLDALVDQYGREGYTSLYVERARALILAKREVRDVEQIVQRLFAWDRLEEAVELIDVVPDLADRSPRLLEARTIADFRLGNLARAEATLTRLEQYRDAPNDRSLRYQLLVATGRWDELHSYIEEQWARRHDRTPEDIVRLASLALQAGSSRTSEMLNAAVDAAPDDPNILASAYLIATNAGIENDSEEIAGWLMRAAESSDDTGPIQRASIEDLLTMRPGWDKHVDDVQTQFAHGELPMLLAATALNQHWLEPQLMLMLRNIAITDPRKRALVPLFSGARPDSLGALESIAVLGIDRTALVTLATLGLLDRALQLRMRFCVPHDTLRWFFEGRHKVAFHQPSRTAFANSLVTMLGRGSVRPFQSIVPPPAELVDTIGVSLANMLSSVIAATDGQHLVVHPFPISRVGSFMSEPVDLAGYAARIVSCSAIVDRLEASGALTHAELASARAYLDVHDRPWPDEPAIAEAATLYLSDLAVSYLRHVDLLDKISAAGFQVLISDSEIADAKALLDHDRSSERAAEHIERIRRTLGEAIADGRVVLDRAVARDNVVEEAGMALAGLAAACDGLVCDDRFINRHTTFEHDGQASLLFTTLDCIEALHRERLIDDGERREALTTLRRMGAMMVPVPGDDLYFHLHGPAGAANRGAENAELRAMRENIRLQQERGWLQLPLEMPWLMGLNAALVAGIVGSWHDDIRDEAARWSSNWLLRLADYRGWASCGSPLPATEFVERGYSFTLSKLTLAASNLTGEPARRFATWLEEEVVRPLEIEEPAQYRTFIQYERGLLLSFLERDPDPGDRSEITAVDVVAFAASRLPEFLKGPVLADRTTRERLSLALDGSITIGVSPSFDRASFLAAVRDAYSAPGTAIELATQDQTVWTMTARFDGETWPLTLRCGDDERIIRELFGLHPDPDVRVRQFDRSLKDLVLPTGLLPEMRVMLAERSLSDVELKDLDDDLELSPVEFASNVAASIERGSADVRLLVPSDRRYYDRLVGKSAAPSVQILAHDTVRYANELVADRGSAGAQQALLMAAHPTLLIGSTLSELDEACLLDLGAWLAENGDLQSIVGYLELMFERADLSPALAARIATLLPLILSPEPAATESRYYLLAGLIALVESELSRNQALAGAPPFRRRCAALAHAALLEREIYDRVDHKPLAEWCLEQGGNRFFLQTLIDFRIEPRWKPENLDPGQIKAEFIGRIINASQRNEPKLASIDGLSDLLFGERPDSVRSLATFPMSMWPGPLEGARTADLLAPPEAIADAITEHLAAMPFGASDLFPLINLSLIFKLDESWIERAVVRVKETGYALIAPLEFDKMRAVLFGLAGLAASERNADLAELVRMLARRRRADDAVEKHLGIQDEIHLALVTAAANEDLERWRTFLKPWLFDIAMLVDDRDTAGSLHHMIETLSNIEPGLRAAAGHALAALNLFLRR